MTPYVCEREYVDLLGRADRYIAHKAVDEFRGPGHAKWDWDYVLYESRPDILATTHDDLVKRGDFEDLLCLVRIPSRQVVFPIRKDSIDQVLDPDRRLCHPLAYPPCLPCTLDLPPPGRSEAK